MAWVIDGLQSLAGEVGVPAPVPGVFVFRRTGGVEVWGSSRDAVVAFVLDVWSFGDDEWFEAYLQSRVREVRSSG